MNRPAVDRRWARAAALCLTVVTVGIGPFGCGSCRACDDTLCGPRTLVTICAKLGLEVSLDDVARLSAEAGGSPRSPAFTMLGLSAAARAKGLETAAMKVGVADLAGLTCSAIAHTWSSHFVVVEGWGDGSPLVTDPPAAAHRMARDEFQKVYSGFALLISKDKADFPEPKAEGADPRLGGGTPGTSGLTSRGGGSVTASRAGTRGTRSWSFRRWRRPAAARPVPRPRR